MSPNPLTPPARVQAHVKLTRWVAVSSVLALIVLALGWELSWAPLRAGGSWLALKALPLCLPLPGLMKHRMYTYRWVSLAVWLYVIEGIVRASGDKPPGNLLAAVQVLLCLTLFVACVLHVCLRQKHSASAAEPHDAPAPH